MKSIRIKLERVAELVEGWSFCDDAIDALERDLALELLREVYSEIRFGAELAAQGEFVAQTEFVTQSEPAAKTEFITQTEPAAKPESVTVITVVEEEVAEPEPEAEIVPKGQEPEPGPAEPETVKDEGLWDVPEKAPEQEPEEPEKTPEREPDESEQEPEPVIVPRRVKPEVIRSLYGSDATETLGDTLNAGKQTLGETFRSTGDKVAASHLAAAECTDLRGSIGLNDKFLMIRDMFDGDAAAFDACIDRLEAFTDLDSAIIHIHETYNWSADSEGTMRLVKLLEMKLG